MLKTITKSPSTPVTRDPFQSLFHRLFQDMVSDYSASEANQAPLANICLRHARDYGNCLAATQ